MTVREDHRVIGGGDVSVESSAHLLGRWLTCLSLMRDEVEVKVRG